MWCIYTEPGDYANPIEPSGSGGLKIARAILRAVHAGDHREPLTHVIGS